MTVVLGYINSNEVNTISAIFSDNLETNGDKRKIVDKITKVDNRFVLGFLGLGLVNWVVNDWIKYFEEYRNLSDSYSSIYELSKDIELGVNFCINHWKTENIIKDCYVNQYKNHPSSIVVLDIKELKLYYLELGKILVDRCDIQIKELEKGKLYEFGVSAIDSPCGYIESRLSYFEKEGIVKFINDHIRELHSIHKKEIGLLGSYFLKIDQSSTFVSCFSDKESFIRNKFLFVPDKCL